MHLISRRRLLHSGAALTGVGLLSSLWIGSALAQEMNSATNSDAEQFYLLSVFLTERHTLNEKVSHRALTTCTQVDPLFPGKMKVLLSKIQQQALTSVRQLAGSKFYQDDGVKDTVQKIVSVWYLGYTGTPVSLRAVDDTRLVTYTGALAYEPTLDATVIPTYSRGHTNYWITPPATLAND
jgi:hypothetical protein